MAKATAKKKKKTAKRKSPFTTRKRRTEDPKANDTLTKLNLTVLLNAKRLRSFERYPTICMEALTTIFN